MKIRPVTKIHGGKYYLSKFIISNFPEDYENLTYLEPYVGGGSVILNKKKSKLEIINDIDSFMIDIYKALRDEPKEFVKRLSHVKYCEETFNKALKKDAFEDYMESATNEFILRRMSRGGLRKAFAWSNRLRGGNPGDVNAWKTALKLLPELSNRIQNVFILNKNAIDVINTFNNEETFLYCDPPYLLETRTSKKIYSSELSTEDHIELSHMLNNFKGKAMISGYSSPLYNRIYN
jgi:DNA adenine methylase